LNGVGGNTIERAKRSVLYSEFLTWQKYRRKRGSLNQSLRLERGFGLLSALFVNSKSKHKTSIYDFCPHLDQPPITLNEAMKTWK